MSYYEKALKLRPFIEKAAQSLPDNDALQAKSLYPKWVPDTNYEVGFRFVYEGRLYRVIQNHTSQESWAPGVGTESIYVRINETNSGSLNDPIPYNGNMTLENGKYYSQDEVVYLCIRDTGSPIYHALKDLIGLYVELA